MRLFALMTIAAGLIGSAQAAVRIGLAEPWVEWRESLGKPYLSRVSTSDWTVIYMSKQAGSEREKRNLSRPPYF